MLKKLLRALLVLLRAFFILLMLVLPVPVGELFHRMLDRGKKAQPTQVKREE
jgi:hypothetical protein